MEHLTSAIAGTIRKNWTHPALSDSDGTTWTYADLADRIARLHILFEQTGVRPGDRIALCGKNSIHWAAAFLASLTYGAVAVPILHDFQVENIHNLVTHSEAVILFAESRIWKKLTPAEMPLLKGAVSLDDYEPLYSTAGFPLDETISHLNEEFGKRYPDRFSADDVKYFIPANDRDMAVINYTSGSTGFSKGVMVSYRALMSNLKFAIDNIPYLYPDDGTVSLLPLAHMFGLVVELMFPMLKGCHIHFLARVPAPSVVLKVFAEVRPKLIIAVPLIIEKIVRGKVFPQLQKQPAKTLVKIPGLRNIVYKKIRAGLLEAFGGELQQLVVGGAAMSRDVEEFLRKIKFPYTVGYGMTECAPLICYAPWDVNRVGSCGRAVDRMELRIESPDPANVPGELWVRGDNVMNGYYKNPEATESVMRDGWMNTGDICQLDSDGFLYIRGRNKSMILGPSGQNIYPEEIETRINAFPLVMESVVVERDGHLVALIHPDYEKGKQEKLTKEQVDAKIKEIPAELNPRLASYEKIADVEVRDEEFEKTPKRSIKRYLYK
ncbi:MAG: long-chain fatty acid--CoA ligase [Bacteroidales bacterium]|nr:long-chain fatty acid--CoA ligase [Bacteroidales bacterium]